MREEMDSDNVQIYNISIDEFLSGSVWLFSDFV